MKKTLLSKNALHSLFWCLALSMLLTGKSWGQPLLVDDFTATPGSLLTANGWTAHPSAGTNPIAIATPSISYLGYGSSNVGNELTMTTGEDIHKTFTSQTSGTVYASFLVNVTSASTGGDYFFHFGQTTIGTTFRGRVFVRRDASNNVSFGISQSTTTVNYSAASYALNTTYLIVLRYEVIDGTANDVSSIYINPPLNAAIPSTGWISNTDAAGTDLANLGSVAVRQGGSTTAAGLKLDGIRVSTAWSDIAGENQTLDIDTPIFDENSVIVFNQNGALNVSTGKNAIKNIRVFDMRGVLIAEQKEVNANTASIKNVPASKQAVLIQITSEDNKTVTKKAIF